MFETWVQSYLAQICNWKKECFDECLFQKITTLYHHLTSSGFLRTSWYMIYEIMSMNPSCSVTLKLVSLFCTLNEAFTPAWLRNIMHWSFGKYPCTELCMFSKFWLKFWYHIKKPHSLIWLLTLSEKIILEVVKLPVTDTSFWKSNFTSTFKFYHWQQIPQCFPLKWQTDIVNFKKMSAKYPHLNNYNLSFLL